MSEEEYEFETYEETLDDREENYVPVFEMPEKCLNCERCNICHDTDNPQAECVF